MFLVLDFQATGISNQVLLKTLWIPEDWQKEGFIITLKKPNFDFASLAGFDIEI